MMRSGNWKGWEARRPRVSPPTMGVKGMPLRMLKILLRVQCRRMEVRAPPRVIFGNGATRLAEKTLRRSKSEMARSRLRSKAGRPETELPKLAPEIAEELSSIECDHVYAILPVSLLGTT